MTARTRSFLAHARSIADDVGYKEVVEDGEDQSVDVLIDYKNAVEDALFALAGALDDLLQANARGDSHASAADVCGALFSMQDGNTFGARDDRMIALRDLYRDAVEARDRDEQTWSDRVGIAQDSEEAETSGVLIGRAEAFREAVDLFDGAG